MPSLKQPKAMPEQLSLFDTSVRSPQSAARSGGGILYQIRYATMRALYMEPGQELGIEYLDDVSLIDSDHRAWYMQVKNEVTPLTNMSPGLWKTLAYWSKIASISSVHNLHLIFVTTAPIHGEFPLMLEGQTTPKERREYIENHIKKSDSVKVQRWIEEVRALAAPLLVALLSRVQIIQEGNADELLHKIKNALRRSTFRDESIDSVAESLEGWLVQKAHVAFQAGRGVQIREDDVRATLQNLRDKEIGVRPLIRHRTTPVNPEHERATYQKRAFYRQLEAIAWPGMDMALTDYLRNRRERADWERHLEVTQTEIDNYEADLLEVWRAESLDPARRRSTSDEECNGRELCDAVMRSASPPLCGGTSPPPHVFRGTYHELADAPKLGWHPRWNSLFLPSKGGNSNEPGR